MTDDEKAARLDAFFDMFDSVEDDISELVSDENEKPLEIGGYECLIITFSNLSFYCKDAGILLKQIEEQYNAVKLSQSKEGFSALTNNESMDGSNEIINFFKVLEQIEDNYLTLEKRSKKTGEDFDEWSCVLIMYSHLRDYCDKEEVDFTMLQKEISRLHKEMDKDNSL
ncbi:MAG: hypothetical protein VB778_06255 [Nitrospinaceae bacterium]|jgi:hypothetical protein